MKNYFVLLLSFLSFQYLYAQDLSTRIEFDMRDDFENEVVLPMGDAGLLVQSFGTDVEKGQIGFKSDFFSTDLKLITSTVLSVKNRVEFVANCMLEGVNYSLLRNKHDYFAIIKSIQSTGVCTKIEGEYEHDATLDGMKVFDTKAIFHSVEGKTDKIVIIDLMTAKVTEVPFKFGDFKSKNITIEDFQVFDNEILVFVNARSDRKTTDLYIARLNFKGEQEDFFMVTSNIPEKLISVSATKLQSKYILTGTFSKTKSDMSQGIYFAEVSDRKLQYIKFYNFLDLKNFSNYMGDRRKQRLERKKERKKEEGEELIMNYSIVPHDITQVDGGYLFLGEAYFPTYYTYPCGRLPQGGSMMCTRFAGYQYTHATLARFSLNGDLQWDNTFELEPYRLPMVLMRLVTIKTDTSSARLMYAVADSIRYKVVDLATGIDKGQKSKHVETEYTKDKVKRTAIDIEPWYQQNFVAYGIQVISNSDVKRKRKVFFINKISID
jgi:hypothetical protein